MADVVTKTGMTEEELTQYINNHPELFCLACGSIKADCYCGKTRQERKTKKIREIFIDTERYGVSHGVKSRDVGWNTCCKCQAVENLYVDIIDNENKVICKSCLKS